MGTGADAFHQAQSPHGPRMRCRCFGKKLIAIIFPIVNGHIVWTVAAPFKTVVAAGVSFAARGLSEDQQKQLDALRDEDEWSTGQNKKDVSTAVQGCGQR